MLDAQLQSKISDGFSTSLPKNRLHFAAHSHHPWPEVTKHAQLKYWQDSAATLDGKWDHIFSATLPESRNHLVKLFGLTSAEQVVEGTNTFDLVTRLFSSFDLTKPLKILTTDSEFYSFERFARRLAELPNVTIDRIATTPFEDFESRLALRLQQKDYDIVFSSLVFFNSGFYADRLVETLLPFASRATIIVDLYHAGGALPVDLKTAAEAIYFVGGGYKYFSAGEGACFLITPEDSRLRPLSTGWLAEFSALDESLRGQVAYPAGAARFAGATFDPSGWYRFNAVMRWWQELGLTPTTIHRHVRDLQNSFIEDIGGARPNGFDSRRDWGNFLTYSHKDSGIIVNELRKQDVFIDARDGYLRFGFGYYQTREDVASFAKCLRKVCKL